MSNPDEAAVKKLQELTSQLDKATAAGKAAVKEVAAARQKAATATNLVNMRRRKRAGKKR